LTPNFSSLNQNFAGRQTALDEGRFPSWQAQNRKYHQIGFFSMFTQEDPASRRAMGTSSQHRDQMGRMRALQQQSELTAQ